MESQLVAKEALLEVPQESSTARFFIVLKGEEEWIGLFCWEFFHEVKKLLILQGCWTTYLIYSFGKPQKNTVAKVVFSRLFCGLQLPIRWLAHYRKKTTHSLVLHFWMFSSLTQVVVVGKCLIHMLLKETSAMIQQLLAIFWTQTSSRNGSEKQAVGKGKRATPKALNSGKSLHISSNMCISLKPPRLWVVEATMIHLATTIWNLTDLGCLFPKKNPKSVTISNRNQTFSFQIFRTNLPNPSARCWFPCPEPLQGLKLSWSSCLGTGKPSQIDPPQWPKTRWWQLKYLDYFHPENWGRWTQFWRAYFSKGLVQPPTRRSDGENWIFSDFGWGVVEVFSQLATSVKGGKNPPKYSGFYTLKWEIPMRGGKGKALNSQGFILLDRSLMRSCSQSFRTNHFWMLQFSTSIFLVS